MSTPYSNALLKHLDEKEAERISLTGTALTGDEELIRLFKVDDDKDQSNGITFMLTYGDVKNYDVSVDTHAAVHYVDDPMADGVTYSGRWRVAFVRKGPVKAGESQQGIQQILRKGLATTLDWTEARFGESSKYLPSSSTTVSEPTIGAISDAAGDSPQRVFTIHWVGLNPGSVSACLASLPYSWGTTRTIQENVIAGPLTLRYTSNGVTDDGSGIIVAVYSEPQFTLTGFQDYLGSNQKNVHKLYQVPQSVAQSILTSWKNTAGNSAIAGGFDSENGLVDLTLYSASGTAPNLEYSGFDVHCDTKMNIFFGWGYTEANMNVYLSAHKTYSGSMAGVTRELKVNERGDGLYDFQIIEYVTTYDAAKHLFSIDLYSGADIKRSKEWGWKVPLTDLETKKATYNTAEDYKTKTWEVSRKDDCTFDFEASITEILRATTRNETFGDKYHKVEVERKIHDPTATDISVQSSTDGVTIKSQVEIDPETNARNRIKTTETEINESLSAKIVDSLGETQETQRESAIPSSSITTPLTATVDGEHYEQELEPHGNGFWTRLWRKITRKELDSGTLKLGMVNQAVTLQALRRKRTNIADLQVVPANGEKIDINGFQILDDGLVSCVVEKTTAKEKEGTITDEDIRKSSVTNLLEATATAVNIIKTAGTVLRTKSERRDDNLLNTERTVITPIPCYTDSILVYHDGIINRSMKLYFNQATPGTAGDGVEISNVQYNDFGLYDYVEITTTILQTTQTIAKHATYQVADDVVKAELNGWAGSMKMYAWILHLYRTVTVEVNRLWSLAAPSIVSVSYSLTQTQLAHVGYDSQRGVWFTDTTTWTYGNWTDNTAYGASNVLELKTWTGTGT
jgi:hypothetical protein